MALIAAAAILDGLDGRVARMLDAQSAMGAEIDSLADAVNFGGDARDRGLRDAAVGVAGRLGSGVALRGVRGVAPGAVSTHCRTTEPQPAYTHEFFVGMPAPAGAVSMIGLIGLKLQFPQGGWWTSTWFLCLWVTGTSILMVSKIPMRKMHAVAVPPSWAAPLLAVLAICAAAAVLAPYVLIWVIIIAYLCHVPFSIRNQRWLAAHPEVWDEKPEQRRAVRRASRRAQPSRRRYRGWGGVDRADDP